MAIIHTHSLPPGPGAARQARAAFSPFLERLELAPDVRDGFLLAMSELVTNLSNHPVPLPESIRVTLSRTRGAWLLEIADNGPPFAAFESISNKNFELDELRECGMGIQLVRERFPDCRYLPAPEAADGWNHMELRRPIGTTLQCKPEVLVVDDDPVLLKVLDGYLRAEFTVVGLNSVDAALAHLERGSTALIISDIHMPGTNGYDFRRQIHKTSNTADIPFILLTGSNSDADLQTAVNLSIDDFLTKPVDKRQLIATIRRVLKRSIDVRNQIGDRLDAEITSALEPQFSEPPQGFSAATAFQAAAPGGGDLLIERRLEDGHLVVLADVMGHGEQAKFFAHALNGFVYGAVQGLSTRLSPGTLLNALSDLFHTDRVLSKSLATALVLVIDRRGGITMSAAGHPPPFLVHADRLETIDVGGPLLGLMKDAPYSEQQMQITSGERLVLYTDGVSEAGRNILDDPADLLGVSVEDALASSDEEIASGMIQAARWRSPSELEDDATVIVLRRNND